MLPASNLGSSVAPLRRRPYSHTSSIKSIIHGPNIEDVEEELQKLELEQEALLRTRQRPSSSQYSKQWTPQQHDRSLRSSRRPSTANPSLSCVPTATPDLNSVISEKIGTICEQTKVKAADLKNENREEALSSGRLLQPHARRKRHQRPKTCTASFPSRWSKTEVDKNKNSLSRSSSEVQLWSNNKAVRNSCVWPVKVVSEKEPLAERFLWGVRGGAENQQENPEMEVILDTK